MSQPDKLKEILSSLYDGPQETVVITEAYTSILSKIEEMRKV